VEKQVQNLNKIDLVITNQIVFGKLVQSCYVDCQCSSSLGYV